MRRYEVISETGLDSESGIQLWAEAAYGGAKTISPEAEMFSTLRALCHICDKFRLPDSLFAKSHLHT